MIAPSRTILNAAVAGLLAMAAGPALPNANPCASIEDATKRLACYDQTYGGAASGPTPVPSRSSPSTSGSPEAATPTPGSPLPTGTTVGTASTVITPAAVPPAIKTTAQQVHEFGLSAEAARKQAEAARPPTAPPPPEIVTAIDSTVTEIARRPTGQLVFKLANGQVWTQIETDSRIYLTTGQAVTIRKALLGSYTLVTEHNAFKVRRIQ